MDGCKQRFVFTLLNSHVTFSANMQTGSQRADCKLPRWINIKVTIRRLIAVPESLYWWI